MRYGTAQVVELGYNAPLSVSYTHLDVYKRQHDIPWGGTEQLREDFDALPRAGSDEEYDAYLARVEDVVASCVERLRAGDIAPAPLSSDVCEYCKAVSFCPRGGA